MEATNKHRENLTWPDEGKTHKQLEVICELAKELRTDYPTDTADESMNWNNEARNRRNTLIRAQFSTDETARGLINGAEWLELFDLLGFSVDKETRKRFTSHLKWYSFWYADFKPRLSSKYAQRIHWYVYNFLFCLCNKLQTEKEYREGKYGSKGQSYFMEIEQQPAQTTETPQISTETAEAVNVSAEGEKEAERAICAFISKAETTLDKIKQKCLNREIYVEDASRYEFMVCMAVSNFVNKHKNRPISRHNRPKLLRWQCTAEQPEPRETAEIKITSITQLNVLKYKLQHPKLKEWAVKYGLLDLVRNMYYAPELSLGGLWIDNKFRQSLCENDKAIIAAVRKLIAEAEKAA